MASHIERRKLLATLGGAAVAWPLATSGTANEIARALISMMAGSMARSKSKAGYIDARPHIRQLDEVLLQRTAGVKLRPSAVSASSRLYLKEQTSPGDARRS